MKAKDLIKVLQGVNPESSVTMTLGRNPQEREEYAKAELVTGSCLEGLKVDRVEIYDLEGESGTWADIVLDQYNLGCLQDSVKEFDKTYYKIRTK